MMLAARSIELDSQRLAAGHEAHIKTLERESGRNKRRLNELQAAVVGPASLGPDSSTINEAQAKIAESMEVVRSAISVLDEIGRVGPVKGVNIPTGQRFERALMEYERTRGTTGVPDRLNHLLYKSPDELQRMLGQLNKLYQSYSANPTPRSTSDLPGR